MARHTGASVAILTPSGRHGWRVQWRDPDTRKVRRRTIPAEFQIDGKLYRGTTKSGREVFRAHIEDQTRERAIDLDRGATRKSGTAITDAADRYFAQADLADEASYRLATSDLVGFYERNGTTSCDDVTAKTLWRWREHVVTAKRKNGDRRARSTVNTRLRKAKTALIYMHRAKLLPKISRDEIAEACAKLPERTAPRPILKPRELRDLFAALERHDADTYGETPAEKGTPGRARHIEPLAPFFGFALLTGLRREELLGLTWDRVELRGDGSADVDEAIAKGGRPRVVHFDKMPTAKMILASRKLQTGGRGRVWPFTEDEVNQALRRLRTKYGAPKHFGLKALRRTCATYLTNAPGIYGGASVYASAEQLGHSIDTAKSNYLHRVRNIDPKADTLEAALEISDELAHVVEAMQTRRPKKKRTA